MFVEFPVEEYQIRLQKTKQLMMKYRLDALLLTTEINTRYLTGLVNNYYVSTMVDDVQMALIPGDESGEPLLLLPDHNCRFA